ncbi:AP-4 complex accessory subunit Tepsin-like isoform X2 [Homarus americanus]|uniref:AP-4 complex accessory subunit Tepsin-like isoform X2 n=1 Tax=Homarus americanus TaxID=6706 RepID=UPI001C47F259|nr:AP-4 complex accessory subunit Tepsin-like isoform X2 [Homarus americanus]
MTLHYLGTSLKRSSSHHSPGHRQLLVDFLLTRLQSVSWPGKQKIVRILQHVCSRGHRGVRVYLRGKDGELRRVTASGGPPDPVLANTPQLFLSSAIQELLTLLFDPRTMKEDEIWMAGKENGEETTKSSQQSSFSQGYGSQASKGKYEGFGSSPINQGDNLVNQVRGIVERVMSPSGDTKKLGLDFLQGEKGDYQPLSLPSIGSSVPCLPQSSSHLHIPVLSTSHPTKYKAHRAGRAGGGWESDEDAQEASTSPLNSEIDLPIGLADHHPSEEQVAGVIEEEFLNCVVDPKITWPLDHDRLVELCQKCTVFDITLLLGKIDEKVAVLINSLHYLEVSQAAVSQDGPDGSQVTIDSEDKLELNFSSTKILTDNVTLPTSNLSFATTRLLILLLLVEFGIHYDILPPNLVNNLFGKTLQNLHENCSLQSIVRTKAKKLSLITCKFI